jgi:hypothetical protein
MSEVYEWSLPTYTWTLKSLKKQSSDTVTDAVVQTYWECTGTDADGDSGTFSGATPFNLATIDPDSFTAYDQLTQAQVLGWIQDTVNADQGYKEHIDGQIANQIALVKQPETEVDDGSFPWDPPAEEPVEEAVSE